MKRTCATLIASLALMQAGPALAGNWTTSTNNFTGTTVYNPKTGESFRAIDEKTGKKQAKALNKMEDKQKKKKGNGFMDDGSEACSDPSGQVLC